MRDRWPEAATGLALGVLALGPALAPGFVLSYDMVFAPDPEFTRMTFGLAGTLPRNVPSDAFATLVAALIPADVVQKLILLAVFVMACVSAGSLVPSRRVAARLGAGICYAWNPYVAERLVLGQWALLLGYAALPWVAGRAAALAEPRGARRLLLALVPAAIGGFAALGISALVALAVAVFSARERLRAAALVPAVALPLSLPWLVPSLLRSGSVPGDGAGVDAFAARADTPFGTVGSVLLLGGVWNGETVPPGYGTAVLASLWLLVVLAALVAYARYARTGWALGLAVAGAVGFVLAVFGAVAPGVLKGLIEVWPGFAVLRDGQQFAAPLAVVVAIGFGLALDRVPRRFPAGPAVPAFAVGCLAVLPVAVLPALSWGAAGKLDAVRYPAGWDRARRIIEADRSPGAVLVLPWAAYRSYPWNGERRVLEPLPRFLGRRVIINDAVAVGQVTAGQVTVPAEDPRARRLAPMLAGSGGSVGSGDITGALREAGVRYAVVDVPGAPGGGAARLAGARRVLADPDVEVYRIEGAARVADPAPPLVIVWLAWFIPIAGIIWSSMGPATTLVPRSRREAR